MQSKADYGTLTTSATSGVINLIESISKCKANLRYTHSNCTFVQYPSSDSIFIRFQEFSPCCGL